MVFAIGEGHKECYGLKLVNLFQMDNLKMYLTIKLAERALIIKGVSISMLRASRFIHSNSIALRVPGIVKRALSNGMFGFTGIRIPYDMTLFVNVGNCI